LRALAGLDILASAPKTTMITMAPKAAMATMAGKVTKAAMTMPMRGLFKGA
jgi:hypothetical protein